MIRGALKQITSSAHHRIFDDPSGGKNTNNINTLQKINIKFFLKSHRNITRIHKKFNLQKAS